MRFESDSASHRTDIDGESATVNVTTMARETIAGSHRRDIGGHSPADALAAGIAPGNESSEIS